MMPVLEPFGRETGRTFPSELLDNERCIADHGRGLANMAERGGMHVCEIAQNLTGCDPHTTSNEEAERIMAEAVVGLWRRPEGA